MADQWREPLSGSVTARMLLQQPIPVFDRVRKLAHSSADFFKILGASAHCRADDPRIAALTIRNCLTGVCVLARGYLRKTYAACPQKKVSFPCHVPYIWQKVYCPKCNNVHTATHCPTHAYKHTFAFEAANPILVALCHAGWHRRSHWCWEVFPHACSLPHRGTSWWGDCD